MNEKLKEKEYYCHFELALDIVSGKWKPIILYYLGKYEVLRYSEIKSFMPKINERMLTRQLNELKNNKLISKKVYNQALSKVEYRLTGLGEKLIPILNELKEWGEIYNSEVNDIKVLSAKERKEFPLNDISNHMDKKDHT